MAVTLDLHHLGHTHRAEIRDPSNIITRKIDKHNVFSAFLGIGEQFGGIAFVLCCGRAAGARPCDGANLNHFACQPDMHLRRAANERKIVAGFKAKHVRRRINETQTAIKIEWISAEIGLKSLRQDNLKDVAGTDVFSGLFNCQLKFRAAEIAASGTRFTVQDGNQWKIGRFGELTPDLIDRFSRSGVNLSGRTIIEVCVHDDLQAAQPMIENEKAVCNHEERLGQLELVPRCDWNLRLEEMDCFVPEKTDSAASKPR